MTEFQQAAGSLLIAMELIRRYQQQGYSHELVANPGGSILLRFFKA